MYTVKFTSSAQKQLQKLPPNIQKRIIPTIREISNNPRLNGYKKLTGRDGYRVRVGNYRIVYNIYDNELIIIIIDIDHRKQIYR